MTNRAEIKTPGRLSGRLAKNAVRFTLIYRWTSKFAGIVALILLVRLLSEEAYGAYIIYYLLVGFLSILFSLGIGNTLGRFLQDF